MALVTGELMARIGADSSGYMGESKKVKADAKKLRDEAGKPIEIPGDSAPFEKASEKVKKSSQDTGKAIDAAFAAAARSVAADLQKIETEAWKSGKGVDQAFRSSLDDAKQQLQKVHAEAARTGQGLESELGTSLRDIQQKFKQTENVAEEAAEGGASAFSEAFGELAGAGGPLGDLLGSLQSGIAGFKGGMLATGLVIGGLLLQGIQNAVEQGKVGALIAAQTGQAQSAAGRLGATAGNIFRQNFGESLEAVGEAMSAVFQNHLIDTSAPEAAIESVTEKVITLTDTTGEAANAIGRAARQAVLTGLAASTSEALDLIQRATEKGLNTSEDLLDTFTEYGTQFRVLGLDGQDAMGLISQAMEAGARDTDTAADALKEFGIRAQDGSQLTAQGFQAIGLDARTMGEQISQGGDSAKQALRDTLNALQMMPPGVERSTAAVALFGTKAEDLGSALYHMDLDDAADQFGDFEGAVDEASATLSASQPIYEQWGQNLQSVLTKVGQGFTDLRDGFDGFADSISGVPGGMDAVRGAMANSGAAADDEAGKQKTNADAHTEAAAAASHQADTLEELINKQREAAGIALDVRSAEREYQKSIDDVSAALVKNGKTHDNNTEKGRDNNAALDDLAKKSLDVVGAMQKQDYTVDQVNKTMSVSRTRLYDTARGMGYTKDQAQQLVNRLLGWPKIVRTKAEIEYDQARARITDLQNRIRNLPAQKIINLRITTTGGGVNGVVGGHLLAGQASGAVAEYYANGGVRPMSASQAGIVQSYRRTGVMRVIADNPIADEAFIPLQPNNSRSQGILDEVLKRMRPNLAAAMGMAAGGVTVAAGGDGASAPTGRGGHTFVIHGPDPRAVAREVIAEMDKREALHGP